MPDCPGSKPLFYTFQAPDSFQASPGSLPVSKGNISQSPPEMIFDRPLNPLPMPTMADLSCLDQMSVWDFLTRIDAIDHPEALTLHVAQLTAGMANLKERLEALERERDG